MIKEVGVVGGGSWGSTLANVLADNGHRTLIYMRDEKATEIFNKDHSLGKYLPGVSFNKTLKATSSIVDLSGCEIIIFAVPTQSIRGVLESYSNVFEGKVIVNVSKGIEMSTGKMISEIFEEYYSRDKFVALSGPTHAEEVAIKMPSAIVSSSTSPSNMELVQDLFSNDYFRVYTNSDLVGVEIGGATKNIFSLGIGIIDGLGYGDNTKAAILTRGIHEISKLGLRLGARASTFYGLSGIGDLIATSTSPHSRNRRAGIYIGKGLSIEETEKEVGMVVEGIKTTRAVYELKEKLGIDMPITNEIYRLLFEDADLAGAYENLMSREKKTEEY